MRTDIFLQQLAQRMDGDRKAISQAETILRSMIDRKLWKQMESAEELPKDIEQIETLLERHNIFFRPITLSDRWWTRCTGYMMGFMADDNTPVILKPGFVDYKFIHPKTNQAMAASRHADLLKQEALMTCLPLTEDDLTAKSILRYAAYSLSKYDLLYILMAGIGVALLTMFTPYVSKLIFSEVIPSGDANQIIPIAVLAVLSTGVGFILATLQVFFRDIEYLYDVFCLLLFYMTPIVYTVDKLKLGAASVVLKANPLYGIITAFRACVTGQTGLAGQKGLEATYGPGHLTKMFHLAINTMGSWTFIYSTIFAFAALAIGILVFKKKQDKFILHI